MQSRRAHLRGLLGMAAVAGMPRLVRAEDRPIPPEGIGTASSTFPTAIMGGRPDSVQMMVNRKHLYVGHMFSDGVTMLDASDPRNLKPVNFFTGRRNSRARIICRWPKICCSLANGANIVAMQSYDDQRGYFENTLADSITNRKPFRSRPFDSRHLQARRKCARSRSCEMPGLRHQPAVVDRRPLCLCLGAFRRLHRSHPLHRRPATTSPSRRSFRNGGCRA